MVPSATAGWDKGPQTQQLKTSFSFMSWCGGQRSRQGLWGDSQAPLGFGWYSAGSWADLKAMCKHRKTSSRHSPLHLGSLSQSWPLQWWSDADGMTPVMSSPASSPPSNSRSHLAKTTKLRLSLCGSRISSPGHLPLLAVRDASSAFAALGGVPRKWPPRQRFAGREFI